jgi:hypothetical protein
VGTQLIAADGGWPGAAAGRNERGLAVREKVDLATVAEDVLDVFDRSGSAPGALRAAAS